jgi:uncharacterized protein DUF4384
MLLALFLSALTTGATGATAAPPSRVASTVRITLNQDGYFSLGDQVKLRVSSSEDGYLVVFRATTRGKVRVLYPLDPGDDNFVRGGKTWEIIGRSGKEAFRVDDEQGTGIVYAAISEEPYRFDEFVRGDHWDYRAFEQYQVSDDAEATLGELLDKLADGGRYQFDLATYTVGTPRDYSSNYDYGGYAGWVAPCFGCVPYYGGSHFSFAISFGTPYYYPFYPYYYAGFYNPWYAPFYYGPVYHSYYPTCYAYPCYGGGYGYHYGYRGPNYGYRPPYSFKPGFGGTPVDYRPRGHGFSSPGASPIGIAPRTRSPMDIGGPAGRDGIVRPISQHDGGSSTDLPRRRIGVEDRAPPRPASSGPRAPAPRDGSASPAVGGSPRQATGVSPSRSRSDDDRSPRGIGPSPGDQPVRRSVQPDRSWDRPDRGDQPRMAAPSRGGDQPRRAEPQPRRESPPPSYRPAPRSSGPSGGGGGRSYGQAPRRRSA